HHKHETQMRSDWEVRYYTRNFIGSLIVIVQYQQFSDWIFVWKEFMRFTFGDDDCIRVGQRCRPTSGYERQLQNFDEALIGKNETFIMYALQSIGSTNLIFARAKVIVVGIVPGFFYFRKFFRKGANKR